MKKETTVHMIGQAHLDPVWLWRWIEGRAEALATSKSAADRLDEYPQFEYTRGEAIIYKWIQEEDPELFERILSYITAGKWHVVNGMLVQPDMNLPCGEAFVRQIMSGKKYMSGQLGVDTKTAYCVDSFGHAATLPMIFKKSGLENYVFMRPKENEKSLPQVFNWQAPNGSSVITFRIDESYETRYVETLNHILSSVSVKPEALNHTMCFFGVGNHGGGPTKEQIEYLIRLAAERKDINIVFSSVDKYFDSILSDVDKLQTKKSELQMHAIGCYTANSALKRAYRKAENNLVLADRIIAVSDYLASVPARKDELNKLWDELSFNQFHDIIAGSSTKTASDEAIMSLGKIYVDTEKIINDSLRSVASKINTSGEGGVVFVFNPFPYELKTYVEYEPWTNWENWETEGWNLSDETGKPVEYQLIETEENLSFDRANLNRILFPVMLPPMGYRFYRFSKSKKLTAPNDTVYCSETFLENELLKVTFSPVSGEIISCVDKATGTEFVGRVGWNVGEVLEDLSDTWSHDEVKFNKTEGKFGNAKITVIENGALQSSLLIERSYGVNVWSQVVSLRSGEKELRIKNKINWFGKFKMVKLGFDLNADNIKSFHDIPFGQIERETNGYEFPTLMWMCSEGISSDGNRAGVALINDGKYGCDINGSYMRLSILRSSPYAYDKHHDLNSKVNIDWLDMGLIEFDLAVKPYTGEFLKAGIIEKAREFNMKLPLVTNHCHDGKFPKTGSVFKIESENIEMTAFKKSEDGKGYIIRLLNHSAAEEECKVIFNGSTHSISISGFDVRTLNIELEKGRPIICETDLLEKPL